MTHSKKYTSTISKEGSTWTAQINRQITSKKTVVSKQKTDFKSENAANEWANEQLAEFSKTLEKSNQRHAEQRQQQAELREQRSIRRAEKTRQAKEEISEINEAVAESTSTLSADED